MKPEGGRVGAVTVQGYLKYIYYHSLFLKYLLSTTESTPQISLGDKHNQQEILLPNANTPNVSSWAKAQSLSPQIPNLGWGVYINNYKEPEQFLTGETCDDWQDPELDRKICKSSPFKRKILIKALII